MVYGAICTAMPIIRIDWSHLFSKYFSIYLEFGKFVETHTAYSLENKFQASSSTIL